GSSHRRHSCSGPRSGSSQQPTFASSRIHPPPRSPLFPYTTLFRSFLAQAQKKATELPAALSGALLLAAIRLSEKKAASSSAPERDGKSTRLNSNHLVNPSAAFRPKQKNLVPARRKRSIHQGPHDAT